MDRIDEQSRRKTAFTTGAVVTLADGQGWTFGLPKLRLTPRRSGDAFAVAVNRVGLPDYERWEAVLRGEFQASSAWGKRPSATEGRPVGLAT